MKVTVKKSTGSHAKPRIFILDLREGRGLPLLFSNRLTVKEQKAITIKTLGRYGLDLTEDDVRFSKTLGCSCGCSPGLEVKSPVDARHEYREFFITLK